MSGAVGEFVLEEEPTRPNVTVPLNVASPPITLIAFPVVPGKDRFAGKVTDPDDLLTVIEPFPKVL